MLHDQFRTFLRQFRFFHVDGLRQRFPDFQVLLRGVGVRVQVEAGPVRDADDFEPAGGDVGLRIPAIGGVVGHLGGQVLAEPQVLRVATDFHEEEEGSGEKVAHGLVFVPDDTVLQSFLEGHGFRVFAGELGLLVEPGNETSWSLPMR